MTAPPDTGAGQPRLVRALAGAAAGVLAAAVAMGAAQFAAGLGVPQSSPVLAVGQAAIDLAPPQVKDFAISAFGTNDKTALLGGILVVLALYAAVVGMVAVRRLAFGLAGLAVFAALGLAAALTRPDATAGYVVPTLVGAAAGAVALTWLARAAARLGSPAARTPPGPAVPAGALAPPDLPSPRTLSRRPGGPGLLLPGQPGRPVPLARAAVVPDLERRRRGPRRAGDGRRRKPDQ